MLLEKIVIEGIMPERALSKLQREGICVYHAKKLKKNQILLSVKKKDTEKQFHRLFVSRQATSIAKQRRL